MICFTLSVQGRKCGATMCTISHASGTREAGFPRGSRTGDGPNMLAIAPSDSSARLMCAT